MSRFLCWLRSFCIDTTMPVGRWVMRMAESVLLTFWPPAPEARKVSMRTSLGLRSMSMSSSTRSEEHTSELQSRSDLVCRLLLENKKFRLQYPNSHDARLYQDERVCRAVGGSF